MAKELCPYCKKVIAPAAGWCNLCGFRIVRRREEPKPKSTSDIYLKIGAAALVIAGVTVAFVRFAH
jgi:hypothetical protein